MMFHKHLHIAFICVCISIPSRGVIAQYSSNGIDASWEFDSGLEGWGQATANEMGADVFHMGDMLCVDVKKGPEPYIDSPNMNMSIGREQTVAIRYRYVGRSSFGMLRLIGTIGETLDQKDDFYFPLVGDSKWHIGYIPLKSEGGLDTPMTSISRMRLWPGIRRSTKKKWQESQAPRPSDALQIDWIRLVRAPIINRITGCSGVKLATEDGFQRIHHEIDEPYIFKINDALSSYRTIWKKNSTGAYPYASTYNCLRRGGENITIEGYNLGNGGANQIGAPAHVFVDKRPCKFVKHDPDFPQERLTCMSPPLLSEDSAELELLDESRPSTIEVKNGLLPGLVGVSTKLIYASRPHRPVNVVLSNFASRSIDISWLPGGALWQQMTCTGFVLKWRNAASSEWENSAVFGNVTTTTIRGLSSSTMYVFGVAALNENQNDSSWWDNLDLYGRRESLEDALEGPTTEIWGQTLRVDVSFEKFDANSTLNHGAALNQSSIGPTGTSGGEGHYGLVFVGKAGIANCNASSFCCDHYNETLGRCSDDEDTTTCLSPGYTEYPFSEVETTAIVRKLSSYSQKDRQLFKSQCGPSLRLTPSEPRSRGAAFYRRQLEVSEGFDTNFTFVISNPSFRCGNMDGIYTNCRSRGGDGLAFVIQNDRVDTIGKGGLGLGYDGIKKSIAVEFDTYFNPESTDPYENHISIHARGWRDPNSSNHTYSLGHTSSVTSLPDGEHNIRILYEPITAIDYIASLQYFAVSPHTFPFNELHGLSSAGFGIISIYVDGLKALSAPLNVLNALNTRKAWIGFTAATGIETFQAHNILSWKFTSLRI